MGNHSIIELKNVTTDRLEKLSLKVSYGEMVTVIGGSGAGKSSLLMLLNRLDEPLEGEIYYKAKKMTSYPVITIRQEIGLVFQSSYLFDGTVYDNLKFGPELADSWSKHQAEDLLDTVQLPLSYLNRDVNDLSGGEQQRVALARTLANKPEVLLLDEATSALDVRTAEIIEQLFTRLSREKQITIILVTHSLAQAQRLGDSTVFMKEGKIVESGKTKRLFENPSTTELAGFLQG